MTEESRSLTVRKINESFFRIESGMDIALEISESFKFLTDGYKYDPRYKRGEWDGYIRLFNLGTRLMATGLYEEFLKFAQNRDIEVTEAHDKKYMPLSYKDSSITLESVKTYIDGLNLHAGGNPLTLRDYQYKAVFHALYDRNAILWAATSAGKSLILYGVSRYITEQLDSRILIIVPTVGLTTQLKSDFADYSTHNGYVVEDKVHLISSGIDKTTDKPIVISTFQSLKGCDSDFFNSFDAIFVDEGHKIQSNSFKTIFERSTEVGYRLACTGTLQDTKCNLLQMIALTGPVKEIIQTKDLIANGQSVPLRIKAITLEYDKDIAKQFAKVEYEDELNWIITHPKRNNFIAKLASKCIGTTLVFFKRSSQGKILYDRIKILVGDTRQVFFIDQTVKKEERERIRLLANNEDVIIVCSYGTMSTGSNLPAVENMILAHPMKASITIIQSIGRGLRKKDGKTHCNLYDIGDNLSHKSRVNHTFRHFGIRLTIFTREGHEFTNTTIPF